MTKQRIDDGGWFDLDKATYYDEKRRFNGHNMVSVVTRDEWTHEELYRTPRGVFILHHWSEWQGTRHSWTPIGASAAAKWLMTCGYAPVDKATTQAQAEAEV